jgi:hypothetical protein
MRGVINISKGRCRSDMAVQAPVEGQVWLKVKLQQQHKHNPRGKEQPKMPK